MGGLLALGRPPCGRWLRAADLDVLTHGQAGDNPQLLPLFAHTLQPPGFDQARGNGSC